MNKLSITTAGVSRRPASARLSAAQLRVLKAAVGAGIRSDGVRVKGSVVAAARSLDQMGLVRCADLTAYGQGAQVRVTADGIAMAMTLTDRNNETEDDDE